MKDCKIDIFISGDFSSNSEVDTIIINDIKQKELKPRKINDLYIENEKKEPCKEKVVREKMDVSQGKLVIGLDVTNTEKDEKPVVSVYNAILGGGANSKLFQNVREKASLAYVASSSYLKAKNNIFINCGIEIANFEKALKIVKEQLQQMKSGDFTENDVEIAKKGLIEAIKTIDDEQDTEIIYFFGQEFNSHPFDIQQYIDRISKVTKEAVLKVAQDVTIDTIYFLKN